jgi:hypothetical protein
LKKFRTVLFSDVSVDPISHSLAGVHVSIAYVVSSLAVVLPVFIALLVHIEVAKVSIVYAGTVICIFSGRD